MNRIARALLLVTVILAGCATQGTMLVTGRQRPPTTPESVRIFARPPTHYEVIGMVQASSHQGWTQQSSMEYAMAKLKQEAAKLGANGLLIQETGSEFAGRYGPGIARMAATVSAQAIYYKDGN